eukprot:scaffold2742_cov130-Isochrysis_galbana.AAC.6
MFTYYRGYRGAAPKLARGSDPPCPESGLRQRAEAEDLPKIEKMEKNASPTAARCAVSVYIRMLGPVSCGYSHSDRITDTGYRRIQVCADTMVVRIRPESWYPPPFPWSRLCLYHSRRGSRFGKRAPWSCRDLLSWRQPSTHLDGLLSPWPPRLSFGPGR